MKSNDELVNELRPGPLPATRAVTPEQKREVIERLLAAWMRAPDLRLGQLISNSVYEPVSGRMVDLFTIEDVVFVESVERFAGYFR